MGFARERSFAEDRLQRHVQQSMRHINHQGFIKFVLRSLFLRENCKYTLKPGDWFSLLLFYLVYIPFELLTWVCLKLDDFIFPEYQEFDIAGQTIFIVGNPRSGTTFLQRLLSKDRDQITSMTMWEILFAPSITQRKLIEGIKRLDRRIGKPLQYFINKLQKQWQENNQLHPVAFSAPEEDQYLFLHNWSTLSLWIFGGMVDDVDSYLYFDQKMPEKEKERIMTFYRDLVKRHLYFHSDGLPEKLYYLSKNPSATPKLQTLDQYFEHPKYIYLVRNPLEMIPSYISLLDFTWQVAGNLTKHYTSQDFVFEMAEHWYSYPLELFQTNDDMNNKIVTFNDLVEQPREAIREVYHHFGIKISEKMDHILIEEEKAAQDYQSKHQYSLEQMGIDKNLIVSEFEEVFDRFDFETNLRTQ